jgi:hypothetical protein
LLFPGLQSGARAPIIGGTGNESPTTRYRGDAGINPNTLIPTAAMRTGNFIEISAWRS